jgi:hypothetical protein
MAGNFGLGGGKEGVNLGRSWRGNTRWCLSCLQLGGVFTGTGICLGETGDFAMDGHIFPPQEQKETCDRFPVRFPK